MSSNILADNGVSSGSAGIKTTADSSGVLALQTTTAGGAATTAVTIDTSQNVGIGTSSPAGKLDVSGTSRVRWDVSGAEVTQLATNAAANAYAVQNFDCSYYSFKTSNSEKVRIDYSGNLLVGTTSALGLLTVSQSTSSGTASAIKSNWSGDASNKALYIVKYDNVSTTGQVFVQFTINQGATGSGQINANGSSAVAFGSFSDRRLKENIVDLPSQLDNIMALRTVEFDYIEEEGGGHQIGFIAQEVQKIYPDLVGEREDGMLTLTDLNKNDARLIKAIQEQQALITTLTERITALEAK